MSLATLLLGAFYAYWVAQPVYRTHVTVMLDPQRPELIDLGSVLPGLGREEEILNTQVEVLRSRELVEQLVQRQNLILDPEFNASLRGGQDSSIRGQIRRKLEGWGMLPPKRLPQVSQQTILDATVTRLVRRLEIDKHPESLVFTLAIGTNDAIKSAAVVNGLAEIYVADQVTTKRAATNRATGWLSERVADLRVELEAGEAAIRAAEVDARLLTPTQIEELERNLAAQRARLAATGDTGLQGSIANLTRRIEDAAARQVDLARLQRDTGATRVLYEHFLARLKETAIQDSGHEADARILSRAVVPQFPAQPKPFLIMAVAAVLGAGLGALLVLIRAQWQGTFKAHDEIERAFDLPVLASLPELPDRRRDPLVHMMRKPGGLLASRVRDLRSGVQLSRLDNPPRVIAICSSVSGEGRTTHALLLAQTLAGWDNRVLLVEADLKGRSLSARLSLGEGPGLLSVLGGVHTADEAVAYPDGVDFAVLAAENTSGHASDIFATARFQDLLTKMRQRFDYIIVDTPAALASGDARSVAAAADANVVLVRWNKTRRWQVVRALTMFHQHDLPVAGVALSRVRAKVLLRQMAYGTPGMRQRAAQMGIR